MSIRGSKWGWRAVTALVATILVANLWAGVAMAAAATAPARPYNLGLRPGFFPTEGEVELSWSDPSNAGLIAYYEIFRWHGPGEPVADERSFLTRTKQNSFTDFLAHEGEYRYAVRLVDGKGKASALTPWSTILCDKPFNGKELIPDLTPPAQPTGLVATNRFQQSRVVDLSWEAPADKDLWRYLVYRYIGSKPAFLAYVDPDVTFFTDTDVKDGIYNYHVVAQDRSGNLGTASTAIQVTVDNVAPVVQIISPLDDFDYKRSGRLSVSAKVTDKGAGHDGAQVEVYLNGVKQSGTEIDLDKLKEGRYQVEVVAYDLAGNRGSALHRIYVVDRIGSAAPQMQSTSAVRNNRYVTLNWEAAEGSGLVGYTIIRNGPSGSKNQVVAELPLSARTHSLAAPSDGVWTFQVGAKYATGPAVPSAAVVFAVDGAKPTITITAPGANKSYKAEGHLPIQYTATDAMSGVDPRSIKVAVDGVEIKGGSLDLSSLTVGSHQLTVTARDVAGYEGSATVKFLVTAADPRAGVQSAPEPTNEPAPAPTPKAALPELEFEIDRWGKMLVVDALKKWEPKIQHEHYKSLMAKAEGGAWRSFTLHLFKYEGKYIPTSAVTDLLQTLGQPDLRIDPALIPDNEITEWKPTSLKR